MITLSIGQLVVIGLVFIVLMALTMRSVILRDRAMIRHRQDDAHKSEYEKRWRKPEAG
jgi:hypothetical protein